MRKAGILAVLLCLFTTAFEARALTGENFDFHGYLRTVGGSSTRGGAQECYGIPGSRTGNKGNEFRLGNECFTWGEVQFDAHHLKAKAPGDVFFDTVIRFYFMADSFDWSENANMGLMDAYIQGGGFEGSTAKYWAGKRSYRYQNVQSSYSLMNDFFYFANTSGNGGGVEDIKLGSGKLSLAYLTSQGKAKVVSDAGTHLISMLDARLYDVALSDKHALDLWLGFGWAPSGKDGATEYDSSSGLIGGVQHKWNTGIGTNHLSVIAGNELFSTLDQGGDAAPIKGANPQDGAFRIGVVENVVLGMTDDLDLNLQAFYYTFKTADASGGYWLNVGARPVYRLSEHTSLALEVGMSKTKDVGGSSPVHTLAKVTIAPQLAIGPKFFDRPVIRAFFTEAFSKGASYGLQGEVWF